MDDLDYTGLALLRLSPDLVLNGLESGATIDHNARRTIGKRLIVDVRLKPPGCRPLTLSGINEFTLQEIKDIRALAALGRSVVLTHHRGIFNVLITSVEPEADIDYVNPDADEWYSATIFLQEV